MRRGRGKYKRLKTKRQNAARNGAFRGPLSPGVGASCSPTLTQGLGLGGDSRETSLPQAILVAASALGVLAANARGNSAAALRCELNMGRLTQIVQGRASQGSLCQPRRGDSDPRRRDVRVCTLDARRPHRGCSRSKVRRLRASRRQFADAVSGSRVLLLGVL